MPPFRRFGIALSCIVLAALLAVPAVFSGPLGFFLVGVPLFAAVAIVIKPR